MNPLDPLAFFLPPPIGSAAAGSKTSALGTPASDTAPSSKSSISDLGRALAEMSTKTSASASRRHQDIDDSDLPDAVKNLLRMIRDLRERLAELARELQAVQTDEGMDPELRRARLLRIRAQMGTLNGALVAATQKLSSLMREMKLDKSQQMTAAQLALR